MIALLLAQGLLTAEFNPPLIFVGEQFTFTKPDGAIAVDAVQASLHGNRGFVKGPKAEFWLTSSSNGQLQDAALIQIPTATVPRWRTWPEMSGTFNGATFLIDKNVKLALVPMRGNYGICLSKEGERRFANILDLDTAVRSGPKHKRPIVADVMYSGIDAITIYARPDNVTAVTLRMTTQELSLSAVALYDQKGTIRLLGESREINLKSGEKIAMTAKF